MGAIDIGAAAIARDSQGNILTFTFAPKANPANDTGTITSVEIWMESEGADVEVATFSASGDDLTTRDSEALGTVAAGSKQTFSGLDMDVSTGDYLGIHGTAGLIEMVSTGGSGVWYLGGDYIPCTSQTFSALADYEFSLYGTGETVAAGIILQAMHHYKQMWGNN